MTSVAVINNKLCNIDSIARALGECGGSPRVVTSPADVASADRVVLPGVGAFPSAMREMRAGGFDDAIREAARREIPVLGICLGMQLLADVSREGGSSPGLGLVPGGVVRLAPTNLAERVPHVGWNVVDRKIDAPLLAGLGASADFYFVHSYHFVCSDPADVVATTPYCGAIASIVQRGNVMGTQFHPEKACVRAFAFSRISSGFEMLKTRIIPTLLFKEVGLVKGVAFESWRRTGSALQALRVYSMREVDELIFLDISATPNDRGPDLQQVDDLADECFMPLTVGGGIRSVDDIRNLLAVGADKVAVNSGAVANPEIIREGATLFGSQCIVASIDFRRHPDGRAEVYTHCGKQPTGIDPVAWARRMEELGAGEILLTSVERDGLMSGYDVDMISKVAAAVRIPVIASGGAGNYQHMADAILEGHAAAVAAASIYHFTEQTPREAKLFLREKGVAVRL